MKTIILSALNAKFIHSNLALRYLSKFQDNYKKHDITCMEFTINQRLDFIVEELYRKQPDAIFFSCYIWNVEQIRALCPILKKILPDCLIGIGGPEVSYESESFLRENVAVDLILRGEGEQIFTDLLNHLDFGTPATLFEIDGLTYREGSDIIVTKQQCPIDLSLLPFPYLDDFSDVENQIIYYESSRGCPYQCGYCLSSVENGVRFVPLEKVLPDLQKFLDARVRQVKFIDRTFNCKKSHAMAIWKYLHEHDNGVTNFHFEITADLIDQETIDFLKTVREGLFQFEIGVQSTNPETIKAINRNVNFEKLSGIVKQIQSAGNIHQHLDLIAGLPYEDYDRFAQSFNDVYALHPEQLQLGFLKVLKGSMIYHQQKQFDIVYHDTAPYEVLTTHKLHYQDTLKLKYIEEMVELYYNSGKFIHVLAYVIPFYDTPFSFFEALSVYWVKQNYHYQSQSRIGVYDKLFEFLKQKSELDFRKLEWIFKYDFLLHEKPKKMPTWITVSNEVQYRDSIHRFYHQIENLNRYLPQYAQQGRKVAERNTHIEVFGDDTHVAILFDYGKKDLLGNAKTIEIVL